MPAMSVDAAFAAWMAAVPVLPPQPTPPADALGLGLRSDVVSPHDLPPFPRAMMDGFAIRLEDAGRELPVAGAVHAGDAPGGLPAGAALAIMTGAPVPTGAEAVVPREDCQAGDGRVRLPQRVRPQANIVPRGGEALAGATVLRAGAAMTPMAVAVAAALGIDTVPVARRPRVAVLTTGSELRQGGSISGGAIRDSNGPMLAAMCVRAGADCTRRSAPDDADAIAAAIAAAAADLTVLTGGVSAGDRDLVPEVLGRLGCRILVRGVDQKPGKPLLLAAGPDGRLFAALPGNPQATHWCFVRFVAPALRRLAGLPDGLRREAGVLEAVMPGSRDRPWFVPAEVRRDGARLLVTPRPPVSSGDVVSPAHAEAYVAIPAGAAPRPPGEAVEVIWCDA